MLAPTRGKKICNSAKNANVAGYEVLCQKEEWIKVSYADEFNLDG